MRPEIRVQQRLGGALRLLGAGSAFFDPYMFAAADASFQTIAELRSMVDGPVAPDRRSPDAGAMSEFIKGWARKLGALDVGITELRDYHKYSTIGRTEPYGEPVQLDHRYAIALTVEMAKEMLDRAPRGPTIMESAQQYMASGAIAVQVAEFIRNLGHPARAHVDGNYRVVCPLVARDAGLGEIGRMGLLMTPGLGPRVRVIRKDDSLEARREIGRQMLRDHHVGPFRVDRMATIATEQSLRSASSRSRSMSRKIRLLLVMRLTGCECSTKSVSRSRVTCVSRSAG